MFKYFQGLETCTVKSKDWQTLSRMTKYPDSKTFQQIVCTVNDRFSRLVRHPAWKRSGTILVQWEGMEKQENR